MNKIRPKKWYRYHSQADLMWPDSNFIVILYVMSDALRRVLL
jgi:hypothetical protein